MTMTAREFMRKMDNGSLMREMAWYQRKREKAA